MDDGFGAGIIVGVIIGAMLSIALSLIFLVRMENGFNTKTFEERVSEHACKVVKVNGQEGKKRTCVQPDGQVFKEE